MKLAAQNAAPPHRRDKRAAGVSPRPPPPGRRPDKPVRVGEVSDAVGDRTVGAAGVRRPRADVRGAGDGGDVVNDGPEDGLG